MSVSPFLAHGEFMRVTLQIARVRDVLFSAFALDMSAYILIVFLIPGEGVSCRQEGL